MTIDRHWMTALEMQFTALRLEHAATKAGAPDSHTSPFVRSWLPKAAPFSWSKESTSAVWMASKSIPEDTMFEPDVLPEGLSACWWWLESPLPIPMKERDQITREGGMNADEICALLLIRHRASDLVICDGRMSDYGPAMTGLLAVPIGVSLKDVINGVGLDVSTGEIGPKHSVRSIGLLRFILAASAWLKQRIVSVESGHIERHRRKQLARENGEIPISDVKVVQLRRSESAEHEASENGEHVEWSCRWVVSGHWRNQPYGNGLRKLIYILPYVKGPDNKPLKVPTHTVYQVSR